MPPRPRPRNFPWLLLFFPTFALAGLALAIWGEPDGRATGWICAGMFGGMGAIFGASEGMKKARKNGARWQKIKLGGQTRCVWMVPQDTRQKWLLCAVFVLISAASAALFFNTTDTENKIKGGFCALAGLVAAPCFAWSAMQKNRGVALLPEGVLWMKEAAPLLIRWENLERAAAFAMVHVQEYGIKTRAPALGLRVHHGAFSPGERGQHKMVHNRGEQGFDLVWSDEELLLPAPEVAALLCYFLQHPDARGELNLSQSTSGFLEEMQNRFSGPIS